MITFKTPLIFFNIQKKRVCVLKGDGVKGAGSARFYIVS